MTADPIRPAFERAFTGSNRTALSWAAFQSGWYAALASGVTAAPAQEGNLCNCRDRCTGACCPTGVGGTDGDHE